jgi:hypothetical protein
MKGKTIRDFGGKQNRFAIDDTYSINFRFTIYFSKSSAFIFDDRRIYHIVRSAEVTELTGRIRLDTKPVKKHVATPMAPYNKPLRSVASLT